MLSSWGSMSYLLSACRSLSLLAVAAGAVRDMVVGACIAHGSPYLTCWTV